MYDYYTWCLQLQIRRSMSLNKVPALFSYCKMLGFSCRCQGSQQLERGSARFSYKSKCSALKRMEISFNCSLWCKRGLKFQLNLGRVLVIPSFPSLCNIKLLGSFSNRNSQDPSPRGNWIPEQHPWRLLSPDQTIHCPGPRRYPAGLPIRWLRPPPHPLLLVDASLVTALCGLSPGGRGAARFRPWIRTNKDSINLFHPFSMLFHQSQARHHGGKVLQSEVGICKGSWQQAKDQDGSPSIVGSRSHSFDPSPTSSILILVQSVRLLILIVVAVAVPSVLWVDKKNYGRYHNKRGGRITAV